MIGAVQEMVVGLTRWRTSYKLGLQDIELRYKRSLLGPFWISASLLATVLALGYVFAEVFRQDFISYVAFLGAGLLTWFFILALINDGCNAITEHAGLLKNVRLPITVIAGRIVLRNGIVFSHNLIAIGVTLMVFGAHLTPVALLALPGAALIMLFGYFMIMVLGPLCARFRDVPMVVQSVMQVLFFVTPIIWRPTQVSHRPMFTQANPFHHLLELVRSPLLGEPAAAINWYVALGCCAAAAVAAVITVSLTRLRQNLWL